MTRSGVAMLVFVLLLAGLVAAALWAARRTHTANDFFVANRRLGARLTGIGAAAGVLPAWLLLTFCAFGFSWGLSAIWIWCSCMAGLALCLFYIAPKLKVLAVGQGDLSLSQVFGSDAGDRLQPLIARSASLIMAIAALIIIAITAQCSADILAMHFGTSRSTTIVFGLGGVALFTVVGGLWAASVGDLLALGILAVVLLLAPVPAIVLGGGIDAMQAGFAAYGPDHLDLFDGRAHVVALAFVMGVGSFGFLLPGQPQLAARLMAVSDDTALRRGRWIALIVTAVVLAAALVCGWCASVMYAGLRWPEYALVEIGERILPPWLSAAVTTAVAFAVMLSVSSYLLTVATGLSADLKRPTAAYSFAWARIVLVLFAGGAACLAIYLPALGSDHALFAFGALGSAFGPLLLVRLTGKRVRPGSTLGAMWAGFSLTWLFHVLPDAPGDFLERVLPFVAALGIALTAGERRRNPDRADRAQETVHDRVAI